MSDKQQPTSGGIADALKQYRSNARCSSDPPSMFMVDGTGPADNSEYFKTMSNGFLYKTDQELGSRSRYFRGPGNLGTDSGRILDLLVESILSDSSTDRLFLSGYSRGAMICIEAAHRLNKKGRKIHAMFLLDAVDRSHLNNSEVIPANVHRCYHAVRDPQYSEDLQKKYQADAAKSENSAKLAWKHPQGILAGIQANSKAFDQAEELRRKASAVKPMTRDAFGFVPGIGGSLPFGNTGTKISNPDKDQYCEPGGLDLEGRSSVCTVGQSKNRLEIVKFRTSHAGMGGLPWSENDSIGETERAILIDEKQGSDAAWAWLRSRMVVEGVFFIGPRRPHPP